MRLLIAILLLITFNAEGQIIRANPLYRPPAVAGCSDADAQKFIDSAGITDQTQKDAICTLVRELKDSSLWSSFNAIYPFIGGTASSHKWNLKDPQNTDAAFRLTFSGTVTHTSNGVQGNGTNGYANTWLNPFSILSQNNHHLSLYSRTEGGAYDGDMGVGEGTINTAIVMSYGGYDYCYASNDFFYAYNVAGSTIRYEIVSRISSDQYNVYKNGLLFYNVSRTSSTQPNDNIIIMGIVNGGSYSYSSKQFAFATIGAGLTSDQARALNTIVEKFNDALGRGVQ